MELSLEARRAVIGLGPPFSEIIAYVLLEEGDASWAVADDHTPADPYDLSDAPDWVP